MAKSNKKCYRPLGCVGQIIGLPLSFLSGLIWGLAAPVAAVAGIVLGVRLLTGKMPLPAPTGGEGAERQLSLRLVSSEDAKRFLGEQWGKAGDELKPMWDEIQATMKAGR